jgi:Heparinase II/III-like protein/Heparinase II/III N-terminus
MTAGQLATGLAPVHCVLDAQYRDLAVAQDACAGRFHHGGATLTLGRRPDWLTDGLPDDEEWRIEFVKLYEGLDLGHAFEQTGDRAHLDTWQDLVGAFIDQVPVGHDTSDVSARRIQNWIYAAQRFSGAESFDRAGGFSPGFVLRLTERLRADVAHLRANLTAERNHRTLELYALLIADLATGDRGAAAIDLDLLAANAQTDIWADGVHRECSSDYHCIVLRSLVGAIANARNCGLAVPGVLLERTHLAADVARWLHRPDGTTPALSDGDQGDFRPLLIEAARVLDRPDLAWTGTGGRSGARPAETAATFPVGGLVFWRSSWAPLDDEPDQAWGVFDVGPLGDGGHGHYDQLSVELAQGALPLVVDPGRFTYADTPERHWFKGTAGHNTVCVDGLDQVPYRKGKPKGALPQAILLGRQSAPGIDVAVGQATSPCHDAVHTRAVALAGGSYWLIHDRLAAPSQHRYEVRWHLAAQPVGAVRVVSTDQQVVIEAGDVRIVTTAGAGTALADVRVESGWVSPVYGVRHEAPVVVVCVDGSDAELCTAIGGSSTAPDQVRMVIGGDTPVVECSAQGGTQALGWGPGAATPWRRVQS